MAAAADGHFNFSHVITFDPATHRAFRCTLLYPLGLPSQTGLDPWDKTIPIPLLAINSEEYAGGDEFAKLLAIASCAESYEIYVIREYRRTGPVL